jgi:hypothetical protein
MYGKEKEFTSFDSQGPTDFDYVGFHLDIVEDILKLINLYQYDRQRVYDEEQGNPVQVTSKKLDELRHYTLKLQEYVKESN